MKISRNPWDILGIKYGASADDIKSAYKRLAMNYHPDKGGDAADFKRITEAYKQIQKKTHVPILSKPDTRLVNVRLTIKQQVFGLDGIIETDAGLLEVKIPRGASLNDKFKIRTNGKNYIINVKESKQNNFTRHGFDVIMDLEVDIVDAMLGRTIQITGPCEDTISVNLETGTQTNTQFVIDGEGLLNRRTNKRGNLHIFANIKVPKLITNEDGESLITRLRNGH